MGQRGPAKKPAAEHKRAGTYRADRHATAAIPPKIPDRPADMSDPRATALWNRLTQRLFEASLITELDQTSLRLLCESFSIYLEATDEIKEMGITYEAASGAIHAHPAVSVRDRAWVQIVKLCREFGLTPSSRTGMKTSGEGDADVDSFMATLGMN